MSSGHGRQWDSSRGSIPRGARGGGFGSPGHYHKNQQQGSAHNSHPHGGPAYNNPPLGRTSYNDQQLNQTYQHWGGPCEENWDSELSMEQSQYDGSSSSHDYSSNDSFKSPQHPPPRDYQNPDGPNHNFRPSAQSTPNRSHNQHNRGGGGGSGGRYRKGSGGRQHRGDGRSDYRRDRSQSGDRSFQSGYGSFNDSQSPNYYNRNKRDEDPTVFLSKTLSSILRHNAEKFGLKLMKGGFIYVEDIFQKVRKLQGFTREDVIQVVKSNDKQRFTLEEDKYGLKIRANQGHTMEVEDLDLKPITSADDFPLVIHGTYYEAWEIIKHTGLNRMKRNHIHFAPGEPGANGVISGMRSSCQVMIYLDLEKALKDGLTFFISSNNVILSPGDKDGAIHPRYFDGAIDRYNNYRLEFNPNVDAETNTKGKQKETNNKRKRNKEKKKDKTNQSISSEGSTDNSLEPQPKAQARSTNEWEVSGRRGKGSTAEGSQTSETMPKNVDKATPEKTAETSELEGEKTLKPVDTGVLLKLGTDYGGESEDSDEDSEVEQIEAITLDDAIVEVDDPDISQTVISDIVSREPPFIVVICSGDRLGQEKGHIVQLAVGTKTSLYLFNLQSKCIMEEGKLKELLLDKNIPKVFSRVEEISVSLINEYDILLNGVPIWDLEILHQKLPNQMNSKDREALKKLNFDQGMFEKWSKTNKKSEECQKDLTQQAIMMYRMFQMFSKSLDSQSMKTVKAEIYEKAIPKDEGHFLSEKIKQLKLAGKVNKKKEKGTSQQTPSSSTGEKHQEPEKRGGGKSKNKNKNKRR